MAVSQSAPKSASTNQPVIPDFEEHPVRVILDDHNALWFHVADVCRMLGLRNASEAVTTHVDPEDVSKRTTPSAKGQQQANYISWPGLCFLVFGSTKPEAKRFKRLLCKEVLPAIRKARSNYGDVERAIADGLERVVQGLEQVLRELSNQNAPDTIVMPPRQELRLSHRRILSFQQAIRPIHIEYGKVWTTTLAISEECQANHVYLMQQVEGLLRVEMIQRKDHDRIWFFPDQARSAQQLHCLTEDGFHALWQHIEHTITTEEKKKTDLRNGCERISKMFASLNCIGDKRTKRAPASATVQAVTELTKAAAYLANASARSGSHG